MNPTPEQILRSWRGRGECPAELKNTAQPWRDNRDCDFFHRYSRMPSPLSLRPDAYLIHNNAIGDPIAAIVLEYWRPEYTFRDLIKIEDSSVIESGSQRFEGHTIEASETEETYARN